MTNEAKEQGSSKVEKLYSARSTIEWGRQDQVPAEWYVESRETPAVDYEKFIQVDPEKFSEYETRELTENAVDELFTWAEIEALRAYLKEYHDTAIEVEEEQPFTEPYLPIDFAGATGGDEILLLHKIEGYNLPFQVNGFLRIREGIPSLAPDPATIERGKHFVCCILDHLNITPMSDADIEQAVVALSDDVGLQVTTGKTKEDRKKRREDIINCRAEEAKEEKQRQKEYEAGRRTSPYWNPEDDGEEDRAVDSDNIPF